MSEDDTTPPGHDTTPPDSVTPWTPHQAYRQIKTMRQILTESPEIAKDPTGPVDTILVLLEYMACPHPDCPLMLLEHPPMQEVHPVPADEE